MEWRVSANLLFLARLPCSCFSFCSLVKSSSFWAMRILGLAAWAPYGPCPRRGVRSPRPRPRPRPRRFPPPAGCPTNQLRITTTLLLSCVAGPALWAVSPAAATTSQAHAARTAVNLMSTRDLFIAYLWFNIIFEGSTIVLLSPGLPPQFRAT